VNCLGLIGYYLKEDPRRTLLLIAREDAEPLVRAFCADKADRVCWQLQLKSELDATGPRYPAWARKRLIHGGLDGGRGPGDPYAGAFDRARMHFVPAFYRAYDIPYEWRTRGFTFARNAEAEAAFLAKFGNPLPGTYDVAHQNPDEGLLIPDCPAGALELNKSSNVFLDAVALLESARSMHLIDSVWAALIYCIDAHYGYFRHVPIRVHCLRHYTFMFNDPDVLPNWEIVGEPGV
jgi:hypothetical protein